MCFPETEVVSPKTDGWKEDCARSETVGTAIFCPKNSPSEAAL
jgi:hypothetical protein